jgi:8-oxo-dGTP pyrophosphatase MutT (NUDIX family)
VYYFNTAAAVAGFIEDKDGRLLVTRRAFEPAKGTLDLPGGFVDYAETAEEALKREIREETGLQVQNLQFLFSIPNIYNYSGLEIHTLDLFFRCQIDDFSSMQPADDVAQLLWIDKNDIQPELFGLDSIRKAIRV